ncbi:MAG TPA: S-methyl-5-thioribose-1-phosphate isomerase [Campylobacterales bacterium]|nr:S-methyl-5-thioribose-1-phosphate isomerase [Campylobacterales bacterium]
MQGNYKALWLDKNNHLVVLDQRCLPFEEKTVTLTNVQETIDAIENMTVRGAGVIGNVAGFGIYLASKESSGDLKKLEQWAEEIKESRPTAINLMWAVDRMMSIARYSDNWAEDLKREAILIADEDCIRSKKIAEHGADIIEEIMLSHGLERFNVLTHCNGGWLAIIDEGSALAPIYEAYRRGIDIHVWVDETRPRNQGANLTAWELLKAGVKHTVIADNTGGHLMQNSMVDMVITGADRVARNGDSANKIGTYPKALCANDNDVPFYIALPSSTFDFKILDGVGEIPIEIRSEDEIKFIKGLDREGNIQEIQIVPSASSALNYGFDVTPARLITGLITERGVCMAESEAIGELFKDLI